MVIVALVATVTAGMVWQQTRAVQVEAAERARAQAGWILSGALDWARLILREDLRNNRRRPAARLAGRTLGHAAGRSAAVDLPGRRQGQQCRCGPGGLHLRQHFRRAGPLQPAGPAGRRRQGAAGCSRPRSSACAQVGVPTDTAQRIVQGLGVASCDAERGGHRRTAAGPPLRPAAPGRSGLAGHRPATLARLEPFVDLLPVATPVNLNTAPREVMVAAIDGIDLGSAERLVQARQRKPFAHLDEAKAQLPQGTVLEPASGQRDQQLLRGGGPLAAGGPGARRAFAAGAARQPGRRTAPRETSFTTAER
jgi:general secretion pathway protein K